MKYMVMLLCWACLLACSQRKEAEPLVATTTTPQEKTQDAPVSTFAGAATTAQPDGTRGADSPKPTQPTQPAPRMVIYHGSLRLQVDDPTLAGAKAKALARLQGGYPGNESFTQGDAFREYTIVLRVPAPNFEPLVTELEKLGTYLEHKEVQAEDVNQQYVDNAARLTVKKQVEAQYGELLRRAGSISDVLQVVNAQRQVREEVEQLEGQQRYLANQTELSTVTVTFYVPLPPTAVREKPQDNLGYRLLHALSAGWDGLLSLLVGLLYLWPLWLVAGGVYYLFVWRKRRPLKPPTPPNTGL